METKSKHLMLDIWLSCDLEDQHLKKIGDVIEEKLTVVQKCQHTFEPMGETLVWILSESHFSIHTYPEHRYLSLDIYICNESIDLSQIAQMILAVLPIRKHQLKCFRRGAFNDESFKELF